MANETKRDITITISATGVTGGITIPIEEPRKVVKKIVKKDVSRGQVFRDGRILYKEGKIIPIHLSDCDICGEIELRVGTNCPYCNFQCCKTCFETYLLSTPGDSKCMSCKANFDLHTVWKLCTQPTYKKYLDFRLEQLL